MKNLIITIIILFFKTALFPQVNVKEGIPLEYNDVKEINFKIFNPALRINKADSPSEIDYTKVEGLIQSYFSANDSIWDKSDYFDKEHKSVKDQEHYNLVKKSNKEKEYVEIESIYEFSEKGKKINFVKYAITIDGLPFQIIAVMTCAEINNRWYIYDMFNQGNIQTLIKGLDSNKLNSIFQDTKENNNLLKDIKRKISINNITDINTFYSYYKTWYKENNSQYLKEIRDERNWIENYHYAKAELGITPRTTNSQISMPFSLDNSIFHVYKKGEDILINSPESVEKYKNSVEKFLIPSTNESIKLIQKFKFSSDDSVYFIIKYEKNNKFYTGTFLENKGKVENNSPLFNTLNNLILKLKPNTFIDLNSTDPIQKDLENIRLQAQNQTQKMINLTILNQLIEKNKASLSKYLDQ